MKQTTGSRAGGGYPPRLSFSRILFLVFATLSSCCPSRSWTFREENDYFTPLNNDSDYTQGVYLSSSSEEDTYYGGQRVYTPVHKRLDPPDPNERPYAGYLYVGGKQHVKTDDGLDGSFGVETGIVGPGSFGKESQCGVHALLGQECPAGWSHQLHNEPTAMLTAEVSKRDQLDLWILQGENVVTTKIEAGTPYTALRVSSSIQWGRPGFFYFAGPQINFVAHDTFLDGNTYQDSPSVTREDIFQQMMFGLGTKINGVQVKWTLVISSPQFKEQGTSYNYGIISFDW